MVFAIHWHESAMDLRVFPIPIPPPASLPTPLLWVFPVHQPWALVSCIQPGLVICFKTKLFNTASALTLSNYFFSPLSSEIISVSMFSLGFKKLILVSPHIRPVLTEAKWCSVTLHFFLGSGNALDKEYKNGSELSWLYIFWKLCNMKWNIIFTLVI